MTAARPGQFTGATDDASEGGLFTDTLVDGIPDIVGADVLAAQTAATAAATSETNAANSATSAATSATNAATSETNASNSATASATSATASAASATLAATEAASIGTAVVDAETAATNAAASQTAAANSATSAASSATAATSSANTALTTAAAAANSATAAATSATNAASSETASASSATSASTSETNASNSASAAATSATNASNAQIAAETAETNAETAESNASASATAASNSSTSASTSASTATTKASEASTSATNAATSETNAATSETNAASSATSASTSASTATTKASEAATSATNAATSATSASTAQAAAETAETNAETAETNAANSATAAASSASASSTSETNAATSATNSANSATASATSATNSANSATASASSATDAANTYDDFDDRYLGSKTSAPTTDNDGDPLLTGALYFNSTSNTLFVWNGSTWQAAGSSVNGTSQRYNYIVGTSSGAYTGSTTVFPATYDVGFVDVYLNGVKLVVVTDFTATNGTSITLTTAATSADTINIIAYGTFSLANIDAVTLDGIDSSQFLRSDVADTKTSGDLSFSDNVKAIFGAGNDLQIYHDGSNSYVSDNGTGVLNIQSNGTQINLQKTDGTKMIEAINNGNVVLYSNGVERVRTNGTGVDITGTAIATTQTASVTGSTTLNFGANQNFILTLTGSITLANPSTEQVGQSGFITFIQTGGYTVSLGTDYETAGGAGITLSASGTDVVPYIVAASGRILLGTPQLAFA